MIVVGSWFFLILVFDYTLLNDLIESIPHPIPSHPIPSHSHHIHGQNSLDDALAILQREDPSLTVSLDADTGQTLIKGMGELHLEITRQRLVDDYKVDATMGKMQIAYRESVDQASQIRYVYERAGSNTTVTITLSVEPILTNSSSPDEPQETANVIEFGEELHSQLTISEDAKEAILAGVGDALASGMMLGFPVIGIKVVIKEVSPATESSSVLRNAAMRAVQKAIEQAHLQMLEPYMRTEIVVDAAYMGDILSDVSSRRGGAVLSVNVDDSTVYKTAVVEAEVPLAEMRDYASSLRSSTKGTGSFSMSFQDYRVCPIEIAKKGIS